MNNLKPGDILTRDGAEIKVIASFNTLVWTTIADDFYEPDSSLDSIEELLGWTKKEEPWVPKEEELYWYIRELGGVYHSYYKNDSIDQARASFLGVFPTEEAATKRRDEIIKLIRK